jgi:hypothetical protein
MAGEQFVSLTTYRRDGTPVSVPVWVAGAADRVILRITVPSKPTERPTSS